MSREPRRYRVWAGCPGGVPEDVTRCIESVRDKGRSPLSSQCSKKRRPGSDYCGTHDPVNVKARRDKAQAKYEAQLEASPHRVIARLRASLAAAEAKLADERKHADWLAKQYRECSVWPSTEEQHAGCECGWMWGYMEHGDFEQEEQHAPECPNAVHAARRAAEKEEGR